MGFIFSSRFTAGKIEISQAACRWSGQFNRILNY